MPHRQSIMVLVSMLTTGNRCSWLEVATTTNKEHDLLFLKDVALTFCRDAFFQPCTALEEPHFVYKKDGDIILTLGSEFVEHSALFFSLSCREFCVCSL